MALILCQWLKSILFTVLALFMAQIFGSSPLLIQNLSLKKIAEGGAVNLVWVSPVVFPLNDQSTKKYEK